MALLNTGCLISTIQTDVTVITTGYAADCFTIIAAGVDGATQDRCVTVPTSGSLPSLWPTQSVPQGQVVFVEDVGVPVIAASGKWIGFDQRVFRSDLPKGELLTWGGNTCGQLGDSTITSRSSPGSVSGGGTTWCVVSLKCLSSFGIKSDGTLWSWGTNGGRLGDGGTTNRSSPGTTAGGGTTWCCVSSGRDHAVGIKTDGTVWVWGANLDGRLGDGTTTARSSPVTTAGGGTNWKNISAGRGHSAGLKTDGTLWTWGFNLYGQLGEGSATNRSSPGTVAGGGTTWCAVSAGYDYTAAVKTDGSLWTWGRNSLYQLGDGTATNRCSPGTINGGGSTWCEVSAGYLHGAALKTDGTLWGWGYNGCGLLGDGTVTTRSSPVSVAGGGTTWSAVGSGQCHTAAIKTDGTLWTWGRNNFGQLGDGTTTNRCSPGTTAGGITTWFRTAGGIANLGLRT